MAQRVTISIVADASQADAIINKLNSQLGNIGNGAFKAQVSGINQLSEGMLRAVQISDQLVRTGYRLTLGLSGPIIAAAGYVVKLYSELEVARIAFTAFTGSVDIANEHLKQLYQFAIQTPFNFSQVVQLSRQLQGVGIAASAVIPLLRSVGNAVALLGGGNDEIERVVNQLVHIQALSRVTLRELNPIARAGIPVFEELANAIRKPGEAAEQTSIRVKALLQKGLIPGPEFIKFFAAAQDIRFPDGLTKVSESIKVQLSNLVDVAEQVARVFGQAFDPAIRLIISSLSVALKVVLAIGNAFALLPVPLKAIVGIFIALLAVVGPLVLGFGYLYRSLISVAQFFSVLNKNLEVNTAATTASVAAANAAASAKLKEAEASSVLSSALKVESAAQASSATAKAATVAEQLPLFAAGPRQRTAGGQFVKEEKYVPPAQLPLGFSTSSQSFINLEEEQAKIAAATAAIKIEAEAAAAAEAAATANAAAGLGGLFGILGRVTGGFLGLLGITELSKAGFVAFGARVAAIGGSLLSFAGIVGTVILAFQGLEYATGLLKDIPGFKWLNDLVHALDPLENISKIVKGIGQELKNLGISQDIKNFLGIKTSPEDLFAKAKPNAQQAAAIANQALRDGIARKEIEKDRLTLLQDQLEVERQAREFSIDSNGKELKGLELINSEYDKRLLKATTKTHTLAASGLPEEVKVPLDPIASLEFVKGRISEQTKFLDKNREDLLAASQKADDEIFKNRIEQLDTYTKTSSDRLQALASSEIISTASAEAKKQQIQLNTIDVIEKAQRAHTDVLRSREEEAIGKQIHDLGTIEEVRKNAQARAANTTSDPQIQQQLVERDINIKKQAEAKLQGDLIIAHNNAEEQKSAISNQAAKDRYEIQLSYALELNKISIDLLNKERDVAFAQINQTAQFEKSYLNTRKEAELKNLEFIQPATIQQELAIEQQKLSIREDYAKRDLSRELQQLDLAAQDRDRREQEELRNRGANEAQINEYIQQLDQGTAKERLQITASYYQQLSDLQRDSALQQVQILRNNTLSVFDTIKKSSDTLLDQLLSRSKSIFGAIGDAIKSTFLTAFKSIVSSQISSSFTQLVTGQKVTFQSSGLNNGPLGGLGNFLAIAGLGKPIAQINAGGVQSPSPYDAQLQSTITQYQALVAKQPTLEALPTAPILPDTELAGINTGISDTLEILKKTLGNESGIGYAEIKDGSVKTILTNLDELAKVFAEQQKKNIAATESTAAAEASGEDSSILNKLTAGKIAQIPGTLGDLVNKIQGSITAIEAGTDPNSLTRRLNNPGALEYRGQLGATPSNVLNVDKVPFAQFSTLQEGQAALQAQILKYISSNQTLLQIFQKYAPASDPRNNPIAYANAVGKAVGIGTDVPLKDHLKAIQALSTSSVADISNALATDKVNKVTAPIVDLSNILQDQKPNIFTNAYVDLKQQFREITGGTPDAVSSITKTPIYYVPKQTSDGVNAVYDKTHDVIQVFSPLDQAMASVVHEDVHALLNKSHESIDALTNLIPVDTLKQAHDVLKTRYDDVYKNLADRTQEIIPRLIANQGNTLGLTQPQAEGTINTLINNLQAAGKTDLASKLIQEHGTATANTSYGDLVLSGPNNTLDSLLSGTRTLSDSVLRDQNPSATITTQTTSAATTNNGSLLPPAISGILGGAFGGVITGAAVGALAGVPKLLVKVGADKVKQMVKDLYGVILDTRNAQILTDQINQKYGGDIRLALHSPEIIKWIQEYAKAAKQVFGSHNNKLSFSTAIGDRFKAAGPGLLAAAASLFSGAQQYFGGNTGTSSPIDLNNSTNLPASIIKNFSGSNSGSLFDMAPSPLPSADINQEAFITAGTGTNSLSDSIFQTATTPSTAIGGIIGNRATESLEPLPGYVQTNPTTGKLEGYGINQNGEVGVITGQDSSGGLLGSILNQATGATKGPTGLLAKFGGVTGLVSKGTGLLGLTLLNASTKQSGAAKSLSSVSGAGALGYSIGSSGLLGAGTAGATFGLYGAMIGAGIGIVKDASGRHGAAGALEGAAGGALAGFGVAGPIGAVVGAVVGTFLGAFGPKTKNQQIIDAIKQTYKLKISTSFAKQLQQIIDTKYFGSISIGIRSKEILDLLALYAQSTNQPFGIANKPRSSTLIQTESGLTQQAIYEGNKTLSFAGLSVYGGVKTQTIMPASYSPTGEILPYQGLPANSLIVPGTPSGVALTNVRAQPQLAAQAAPIIVENKLPENAVGDYMDGRTVRTIIANPRAVSNSQISAFSSNINRRQSLQLQVRPNEVLT